MRLQETCWRECWMTDGERLLMRRFVADMRRVFREKGVQESPLLALRVVDVGVHWLLTRRLELGLLPQEKKEGGETVEISGALADHIGKTRERLRKAVRELEDACARLGAPIDTGVADRMMPVVRKTHDLLHTPVADEETQ